MHGAIIKSGVARTGVRGVAGVGGVAPTYVMEASGCHPAAPNRSSAGIAPSRVSRNCLAGNPPPKPVSEPSAPITRWQGTTNGNGLRPFAAPPARTPCGLLVRTPKPQYLQVDHGGTSARTAPHHTW